MKPKNKKDKDFSFLELEDADFSFLDADLSELDELLKIDFEALDKWLEDFDDIDFI